MPQTPEILTALLSDDVASQAKAISDLNDVVHHQDTIYSATPPAVDFVVAVLDDPRTLTPVPPGAQSSAGPIPLRAAFLNWLTAVMEAAAVSDEWAPGQPADIAAYRAARPHVYRAACAMRVFRENVHAQTALGQRMRRYLDAGELFSEEFTVGFVAELLDTMPGGWILAEFPRTLRQAELLAEQGHVPHMVIEISMTDEDRSEWLDWPRMCSACGHESHRGVRIGPASCAACGGTFLPPSAERRAEDIRRLTEYRHHASQVMAYYEPTSACHQVDDLGE